MFNGPEDSAPVDLTLLSDQFSDGRTITVLCTQETPCQRVWVVDSQGDLWGSNYNGPKAHSTWFKFTTNGKILTLVVCPASGIESELWAVIERTVNGTDQRYIEKLAPGHYLDLSANYEGISTSSIGDFSYLCSYVSIFDFGSSVIRKLYSHLGSLYCCNGSKVSVSADGETWAQMGSSVDSGAYCLLWFSGTLYAGTFNSSRLYEWTGSAWSIVYTFPSSNAVQSLCEFNSYVYAGIAYTGKIYRSSNMTTWTEVAAFTSQYQIKHMCTHAGKLYTTTDGSASGQGIWNTSDGTSWTRVFPSTEDIYALISFGSHVYAGLNNGAIHRSTDGIVWDEVRSGAGVDINCFCVSGTILYVGNQNQLLSTTNGTDYIVEWYDNDIDKFIDIAFISGKMYIALQRDYKYGIYILGSEPHSVVTKEEGYIGEYSIGADGYADISPHSTANADIGMLYNGLAQTMSMNENLNKTRFQKISISLLDSRTGKLGCQIEQDGSIDYVEIFEDSPDTEYSGTLQKTLLTGSGKEIYFYVKQDDPASLNVLTLEAGGQNND